MARRPQTETLGPVCQVLFSGGKRTDFASVAVYWKNYEWGEKRKLWFSCEMLCGQTCMRSQDSVNL